MVVSGAVVVRGAGRLASRRGAALVLGYALLWWLLNDGDMASWWIGAPAVLAATLFSLALPPQHWRLSARGALRFAVYFARESLRGGVDVSLRVLGRQLRVVPGLLPYRTRLASHPVPLACFVQCVGLLPGSLVADIDGDRLVVHVLDVSLPVSDELRRLEDAVAALFALPPATLEARP